MDTYYHPKDLGRFAEIGREAPELWQKFLEWYNAVFKEGALTEREKALIALASRMPSSVHTASMHSAPPASRRGPRPNR